MISRLRSAMDYLNYRGFMLFGSIYLGAASLIGFEALAVLLGYATIWPVGIPFLLACIAVWAVVRRRTRGRSAKVDS
jgi:Na+/proline symporter